MIPKFRVWFSEPSQMITDGLESINLFDETVTITSRYYDDFADVYAFGSIEVDIGNAILMQSTGLEDKNGVEIYEGDIVKLNVPTYKTCTKVICTLYDAFILEKNIETGDYIKILGNIYENPELLEVAE